MHPRRSIAACRLAAVALIVAMAIAPDVSTAAGREAVEEPGAADVAAHERATTSATSQAGAETAAAFDPYLVTDQELRELDAVVADNIVVQTGLVEDARRDAIIAGESHGRAVEAMDAAGAVLDAHESVAVDFAVATYVARPATSRDLERLPTPYRQPPPIDPVNDRLMTDVRRARADVARFLEVERDLAAELADREAELARREGVAIAAVDLQASFRDAVAGRNQTIEDRKAKIIAAESSETDLVLVQGFRVNADLADDLAALLAEAASLGEDWVEPAHCSLPEGADGESDGEARVADEPAPNQPQPPPAPDSAAPDTDAMASCERPSPIIFGGGSYRPRADQITLRIAHCGTSEYLIFDSPSAGCSPPTARPGRSQHELGLAIDFTENGAILDRSSRGYHWLVENAERFGLKNLPSEPWHWSTTGR